MITFDDRKIIIGKLTNELADLIHQGQLEYAHGQDNALANFEGEASELEISREKVLWIFFKKHIRGITAHLNGHTSQREPVQGRIKDAIVYLMLLYCMVEDNIDYHKNRRNQIDAQGIVW